MKPSNKNSGFAILEILLVVVTLSFITAIALVVHNHSKPKPIQKAAATNTGALKVTQWNVFLTNPNKSQKLSYQILNKDQPDSIIVSSDLLDKFAADNKECSGANQFVSISRVRVNSTWNGLPWLQAKDQLVKLGSEHAGAYYYYEGSRPIISPCVGSDIAKVQQLNNQAYDLYDSLPSYKNVALNP
jgi:type II secretory pathway pseudopilin PulG